MTNKYEACMIFSVAGGEESVNGLKEKFATLIAENGALKNKVDTLCDNVNALKNEIIYIHHYYITQKTDK